MRIKTLAATLAVSLLLACSAAQEGGPPFNDSIRQDQLRADLFFLAGDSMRGRRTATPENGLAADFIAARFARLGLEAPVDGSYVQSFDLMTMELGEGNSLAAAVDGRPVRAEMGRDATPTSFSGTASAGGDVVFAGHGIVSDNLGHDDYAGVDVAGKIVLVLDHEPGESDPESPFDGQITAEVSRDWRKAITAQERGAAGILFVQDTDDHAASADVAGAHEATWLRSRRFPRYTLGVWMDRISIPAARISSALASELVAGTGESLETLSMTAEGGGATRALPGAAVEMSIAVRRSRLPERNIVGLLRGSDPELADEVVVLCAHYDHDGANGATVYNGADDDGSGIVGLLEIAEAYALAAEAGQRPRRSILFAAWNAEEVGLLGAWAYTESPLFPLADTVATLNMDMIGRNEEVPEDGGGRFRGLEPQTAESNANSVHLMGYSYSSRLREAAVAANEPIGLDLELAYDGNLSQLLRRSDHWPFLQVGIPSLFFHTGLHPDYHRETDTPDRINYAKMERIARLVHALSWELAGSTDRPILDERRGTL